MAGIFRTFGLPDRKWRPDRMWLPDQKRLPVEPTFKFVKSPASWKKNVRNPDRLDFENIPDFLISGPEMTSRPEVTSGKTHFWICEKSSDLEGKRPESGPSGFLKIFRTSGPEVLSRPEVTSGRALPCWDSCTWQRCPRLKRCSPRWNKLSKRAR